MSNGSDPITANEAGRALVLAVMLAGVNGSHAFSLPVDQLSVSDADHHIAINILYVGMGSFNDDPGDLDEVACDKFLEYLKGICNLPIPFERPESPHDFHAFRRSILSAVHHTLGTKTDTTFYGMIQLDIKAVTCFMKDGSRCFVAHFNTTEFII